MGLGGQFRPTGMPDAVARVFLGVAEMLENVRAGSTLRRTYRDRIRSANTAANDVDWDTLDDTEQLRKIRRILREKVLDPAGAGTLNAMAGRRDRQVLAREGRHDTPYASSTSILVVAESSVGAQDRITRIIEDRPPNATGALAERTGPSEIYNGSQTLQAGDELIQGRNVLQYTGETSPTGRLRFRTFGGGVSTRSGRWSNAYQSYAASSPTLRGRTIRRHTPGAAEQSRGNVDLPPAQNLSTAEEIRNATNGELAEGIRDLERAGAGHEQRLETVRAEVARRDREHLENVAAGQRVGEGRGPSERGSTLTVGTRVTWLRGAGLEIGRGVIQRPRSRTGRFGVRTDDGRNLSIVGSILRREDAVQPRTSAVDQASSDRLTAELNRVLAENPNMRTTASTQSSPARSPAGRIRNVGAMTDQNLINLAIQMRSHRSDTEAVDRINQELRTRGRDGYEIPSARPIVSTQRPTNPFSEGDRVIVDPEWEDQGDDELEHGVVYRVAAEGLDSDGEVTLRSWRGELLWAVPERLTAFDENDVDNPQDVPENMSNFARGDRVQLRPGIDSHLWLRPGTQYIVENPERDGDGEIRVSNASNGNLEHWARPEDLVLRAGRSPGDEITVNPERITAVGSGAADTGSARPTLPHETPANSQQLAENVLAAFQHRGNAGSHLRAGERLEIRTPESGAISRIVRVRPSGSEETFAYIRHRRGTRGTGLERVPLQHQISFVHGTSQILGSALRPGQFRARPRGAEHRLFTRHQVNEAAEVLSNALGASRRPTPPRAGAAQPVNRPGEVPLPGMMATPNRRRDGWHSTPSGDMLPPRDGYERAFGLEIEMTGLSYAGVRTALGREGLPVDERGNYSTKNLAAWVAAHDGSIGRDPEVKFPPLSGEQGLALMRRAVKALRDAGGRAGRQATHGLHVHIDARDMMERDKRLQLAETYKNNRDLINTIVAPARNRGAGSYAREGYSAGHGPNELALNFGSPTIEFRRLGSNLVADDIEGWSILMQSIVNYQKTHDGALPTQSSLLTFMRAIGVPISAQEKILARVARISPTENEA